MNPQENSNFAFITDSVSNVNNASASNNAKKTDDEDDWDDKLHNYMPKIYWLGLLGILVLVVATLMLSHAMVGAIGVAWNFAVFFSLLVAAVGGCFWVSVGVVCLFTIKTVTKWYRPELKSLGIINIVGTVLILCFPLLSVYGLIIGLAYSIIACGWMFYLFCRRRTSMGKTVPMGVKAAVAVTLLVVLGLSMLLEKEHIKADRDARGDKDNPSYQTPDYDSSDLQPKPLPEKPASGT